jgi:hypothetical protein
MTKREQLIIDEYNIRFPIEHLDDDILSLLSKDFGDFDEYKSFEEAESPELDD